MIEVHICPVLVRTVTFINCKCTEMCCKQDLSECPFTQSVMEDNS